MPYVQVDDLRIHYEMEGNGAPLILLHGMGNNSLSWRKQIEELKEDYTVIAWDAPGYGKSSDPSKELTQFKDFAIILKSFLDRLNMQEIYLLGHSMGAATAIDFVHLYPNVVKSVILADATRGSAALDDDENERKLQNRLSSIETLPPREHAIQRVQHLLSPHASEEVRSQATNIMSQVRPSGYRSVAYSLYHADQMDLYPLISVPTLIICGEEDKVTPVSESQIIHEGIPKSEFVTIPRTGHLCYQEDPATFNSHVIHFLQKCNTDGTYKKELKT
ncbi:alpha/beta fold hydrolase [Pseudalkalibacillus decolorationis]|uniref:alpha/beta fold hydrolase n=1 Tax=Pseudalkalibacillus decolorationis TaxID=163879 RepID=UPI00214865D5|nr:alpha/beta hydrolase [Pseudalkalibacillus decolorationis]